MYLTMYSVFISNRTVSILRELERVYNTSPEFVRNPAVVMSLHGHSHPDLLNAINQLRPPAVSSNRLAKRPWHISYVNDVVRPGTVALRFVSSDGRQRRWLAGPLDGFPCFSSLVSTFFFPAC